MERASVILRVSTKGDEQNESLQEPESLEYVKNNSWELFKVYHEQGSAYKNQFQEREILQVAIEECKKNNVKHLVFWNMDRYSRLEPEKVLAYTKKLSLFYDIKIHAVHGDSWSEIVETVSKIKELGFIGEAIGEFLDKLLQGLEHKRAHQESKVKSERVKLAVVRKQGVPTKSYKGNKWGRKSLPKQTVDKVLELSKLGHSIRKISQMVMTTDKNKNQKNISKSVVHKILVENLQEKGSFLDSPKISQLKDNE